MNTKKTTKNFKTGFTLVETLVALSIFGVSIVGLISATASGVADTNFAKNRLTASYLSQEGVELVRNIRDSAMLADNANGWANFTTAVSACNSQAGCSIDPETLVVASCAAGCTSSFFNRIVTVAFDPTIPNEARINAAVSWTQGAAARSVNYSENLFDWITVAQ